MTARRKECIASLGFKVYTLIFLKVNRYFQKRQAVSQTGMSPAVTLIHWDLCGWVTEWRAYCSGVRIDVLSLLISVYALKNALV